MVEYTIEAKELELLKARFIVADVAFKSAQDLVHFIAQREGLNQVEFNLEKGEFTSPEETKED